MTALMSSSELNLTASKIQLILNHILFVQLVELPVFFSFYLVMLSIQLIVIISCKIY